MKRVTWGKMDGERRAWKIVNARVVRSGLLGAVAESAEMVVIVELEEV